MKAIILILLALGLSTALSLAEARYVTHNVGGSGTTNLGPQQRTVAVQPADFVEVVGYSRPSTSFPPRVLVTFEDGTETVLEKSLNDGDRISFTGATQITTYANSASDSYSITYKITTPSTSLVSGVVTLPAQVGTTWNVSLEQSTDLANWSPVAPGTFLGTSGLQFFRVRMEMDGSP